MLPSTPLMKRLCLLTLVSAGIAFGQQGNLPDRLEWFRDQAFGLFIHWSVDGQLGTVISHSLVGASDDYAHRFFTELPKTFNPRKFHPEDWAALAKLAGVRYVVFTAKHHGDLKGDPALARGCEIGRGALRVSFAQRYGHQRALRRVERDAVSADVRARRVLRASARMGVGRALRVPRRRQAPNPDDGRRGQEGPAPLNGLICQKLEAGAGARTDMTR